MYIFIEQLEVGARVDRKVLTSFEEDCRNSQLLPLTNSCRLPAPNRWPSLHRPEMDSASAKLELSIPWGNGFWFPYRILAI